MDESNSNIRHLAQVNRLGHRFSVSHNVASSFFFFRHSFFHLRSLKSVGYPTDSGLGLVSATKVDLKKELCAERIQRWSGMSESAADFGSRSFTSAKKSNEEEEEEVMVTMEERLSERKRLCVLRRRIESIPQRNPFFSECRLPSR